MSEVPLLTLLAARSPERPPYEIFRVVDSWLGSGLLLWKQLTPETPRTDLRVKHARSLRMKSKRATTYFPFRRPIYPTAQRVTGQDTNQAEMILAFRGTVLEAWTMHGQERLTRAKLRTPL